MPCIRDAQPETLARFEREALPNLDWLYSNAIRLAGNRPDAEDLIQETVLKAFVSFGRLAESTNVKAWLYRIMVNTFIDTLRTRKRESSQPVLEEEWRGCAIADPPESRSAEAEALARLEGADVKRALRARSRCGSGSRSI